MGFERYDRSRKGSSSSDNPTVSVWTKGKLAFNDVAVKEWFEYTNSVGVWISNSKEAVIGVAPVDGCMNNSYTFTSPRSFNGRVFHARKLLSDMRISIPDQSQIVDAKWNEQNELVEIDLSTLDYI